MTKHSGKYAAVLVGGGPAGIAVLLNAHRDGLLPALLRQGLLIIERSAHLGRGHIGDYAINSDSTGSTFLDPLRKAHEPTLQQVLKTPAAQCISQLEDCAVPLETVGELMAEIGNAIRRVISRYPQSRVLTCCTALQATRTVQHTWRLAVQDEDGDTLHYEAPRLILATGASQPESRLLTECVAGHSVQQRWGARLVQSGDVLEEGGTERLVGLLQGNPDPKVAILGGSTSAFAAANSLLHRMPDVIFRNNGITLFHRKPLRVYYPSAADALADGYDAFGPDDLCSVSQRVFRFAGLRLDSRELLMQVCGIGGRAPEPRVALHQLTSHDEKAVRKIDTADLVIAAFGYRPNALTLLDEANQVIALHANTSPLAPLVNEQCRVLNAAGMPLPNVYGIGLAAGFRPRGEFGGEPSFSGQANGLWLWQNGVGSIIARALLRPLLSSSMDSLTHLHRARPGAVGVA